MRFCKSLAGRCSVLVTFGFVATSLMLGQQAGVAEAATAKPPLVINNGDTFLASDADTFALAPYVPGFTAATPFWVATVIFADPAQFLTFGISAPSDLGSINWGVNPGSSGQILAGETLNLLIGGYSQASESSPVSVLFGINPATYSLDDASYVTNFSDTQTPFFTEVNGVPVVPTLVEGGVLPESVLPPSAIPLPAGVWLMLAGLGALVLRRRRESSA